MSRGHARKRDPAHGVGAGASNMVTVYASAANSAMFNDRSLEVLRYLSTGALSVALNLLILLTLMHFGVHYLVAICVCFVAVTTISFGINRLWTFRKRTGEARKDFGRYLLVALLQLPTSLASFGACVELLHLPPPMAAVAVSALFAPALYLLHRGWSFSLGWFHRKSY
jgi:putative flippase GtrA